MYQVINRSTWRGDLSRPDVLFESEDLDTAKREGINTARDAGLLVHTHTYAWQEIAPGLWDLVSQNSRPGVMLVRPSATYGRFKAVPMTRIKEEGS